jgi:hypothetical protein
LGLGGAQAQQAPRQRFSLTVKPARFVVTPEAIREGQTFDVSDTGLEPLHVDASVSDFTQQPDGEIRFDPPRPLSAASWVTIQPTSFDLVPGQHQAIHLSISPPADPESGEHQMAVLFRVPAIPLNGSVAVSGAIGAQVLIRVPGPVVNNMRIGPLSAPGFADGGPIVLHITVQNLGNVHRDYVAPDNLLAVAGRQKIGFPDFTVLRGSTRIVATRWMYPPLLCICRLRVTTDDGEGHVIAVQARVLIFPVRLALGILLATMGLMLLLRRKWKVSRQRRTGLIERFGVEAYEQAQRELRGGWKE